MKKAFPVALMLIGLVFLAAGAYTVVRGIDASADVRDELEAQRIVTPEKGPGRLDFTSLSVSSGPR
jgi:hypothetical protein